MGEINRLLGKVYVDTDKLVQGVPYEELTTAQITALSGKPKGYRVYNTDLSAFVTFDGVSNWESVTDAEIVKVNSLSDLPTPVTGKITLEANKLYSINKVINIGTNQLELSDNTVIHGSNPLLAGLVYTGTSDMIIGTDVSLYIRGTYLQANSGSLFNLTNLAKDKFIVVEQVLLSFLKGGTIEGFLDVAFDYMRYLYLDEGLEFIDVEYLAVTRNLFDSSGTTFHNYESSQTVTVAANEYVIKRNGFGIGLDDTVYQNISGAGVSINSSTDYTNALVWKESSKHLIELSNNGGSFKNVKIEGNRFNAVEDYECLDVYNISLTSGRVINNDFIGTTNTRIKGINVFGINNWVIFGNSGIENQTFNNNKTISELNSIVNPRLGQIAFNTDADTLAVHTTNGWYNLTSSAVLTTLFNEDFESGSFATNGWVTVNDSTNKWEVGTADAQSGSYSAYISNDAGISAAYSANNSNISHLYIDITFPALTEASMGFWFRGEAELNYDYMRIYEAPTTYTPVAGSLPTFPAVLIGNIQYNNELVWVEENIALNPSVSGTTKRYIFTWRNDNSVGNNPGAILDNIKFLYK